MVSLILAVFRSLAAVLHTRRHLVLENLALRHQLLVLSRTAKTPAFRSSDRLFWAVLSTAWSRWTKALVIVQPQTVVRWHQAGFRLFWRWKSRRTSRDVKDGKADHITREPEQVKAFRDTWRDGIHSYLTYGYPALIELLSSFCVPINGNKAAAILCAPV